MPKNRKEDGGSGNRYYVHSRPYTSAFHSQKQFGTDPLRFFFTADENFDFFRFFRTVTPVGKKRPKGLKQLWWSEKRSKIRKEAGGSGN